MSRDIENIINERVREEKSKSTPSRSHPFNLGSGLEQLIVISLPLDLVILNHENHRLTAQFIDSGKLQGDPTSKENQLIIQAQLAKTEKFNSLKAELKELGQQEPGLITPGGFLVNGNTRCAALRELKEEGKSNLSTIDVAVLPKGVTAGEITDIEIRLQMVRLTHQDYTFTNSLLMMKKFKANDKSDKEVAKAWNWIRNGEKKVKKRMRILDIIEDVRKKTSPSLPYSFFDQKETVLSDLDDAVEALIKDGEIENAESIKNQRLLGIFLGLNKDQIRSIDEEFLYDLYKKLPPDTEASNKIKELHQIKDHDPDFDDSEPDDSEPDDNEFIDTGQLLDEILKTDDLLVDDDINFELKNPTIDQLRDEFGSETDRKVNAERRKSRQQELHTSLSTIRSDISELRALLPERATEESFKTKDFGFMLKITEEELKKLNQEFEILTSKKN